MSIKLETTLLFVFATAVMGSGVGYSKLWLFHVALVFFVCIYSLKQWQDRCDLLQKPLTKHLVLFTTFFCWYFLSITWSINIAYTLRYLFYLAIGGLFAFLITSYCVTNYHYSRAFGIFKLLSIIAAAIGLLEAFTFFRLPTSPFSDHASLFARKGTNFSELGNDTAVLLKSTPTSFWGNSNNFALAMAMLAPFFMAAKASWKKYCATLVIVILIVMTGSRGAFIALVTGALFHIGMQGHRRLVIYLLAALPVILLAPYAFELVSNSDNRRITEMAGVGDALVAYLLPSEVSSSSIGARSQLIQNGLKALWSSYGIGVGAGGSQAVQEAVGGVFGKYTSMHNFWIEILVDGGVIGFSIFMLLYSSLCIQLLHISRLARAPFFRYHSKSLFVSLVIFFIGCITASSVIYFLPMWILLGMSMALIGLWRRQRINRLVTY